MMTKIFKVKQGCKSEKQENRFEIKKQQLKGKKQTKHSHST